MIDDLQAWLRQESTKDSKPPNTFTKSETERIPFNLQQSLSSSPKVVPKGIRSYENEDSDFFLDLLPGPRDRDGIPACVRFWKTRIEEFSPARTFSVGLMYGPSGCSKSSLVKAGLLPLLPANIIPVYVDASADDTEQRIERSLQRLFPNSPSGSCLLEMLAAIREDRSLPARHKVLLVLDQFEQWLHKNSRTDNSRLVSALRQCDGSRIQAVLLVRDDFWLSISRFFVALEVRLVEGENSALVDLFDLPHARRVLIQIGQAFGRLSQDEKDFTAEQHSFLDTSLDGLAIEGRIVPMRLAILSDIFKNRPWTMDSLRQMGGTGGVGSAFLVENFESPLAPPEIRTHADAIPKLFRNLLPESHIEIREPKRSYDELRSAAEYSEKPREFHELIDLLDRRLHLDS